MKNFFETFLTSLMLSLMILIVVMLVSLESSVVAARQTYSECWHAVESSELYTEDDVATLENQLNDAIHKKHSAWNLSIETLTSGTARPYYLVTLDYHITLPIINVRSSGQLRGYAQ